MKNRRKLFLAIVIAVFSIFWLSLTFIHFHDFVNYKYLSIGKWQDFLDLLFWLCLLPILVIGLILIIGIKGKKKITVISVVPISLIFLVVIFMHTLFNGLYLVPFISITNNSSNFGMYDNTVENEINAWSESGFPQEKPHDAQEIQFFYWYYDASSTHYGVMVSWILNDDTSFQTEVSRLTQCGYSIEYRKSVYLLAPENKGFNSEVMIDWKGHRLVYFLFDPSDLSVIPKSLDEFYLADFSKEMIFRQGSVFSPD